LRMSHIEAEAEWHTYYWLAAVPFIVMSFWLFTAMSTAPFPTLEGKRIALVIAHPDDEAMFFAPTVLALTKRAKKNHVRILCLSSGMFLGPTEITQLTRTGNAEGLGETRKKELLSSALRLGIKSAEDVTVLDDANFPDSMTANWDAKLLAKTLISHLAPEMPKIKETKAPKADIDVLITFDSYGISSHPNHKSLYWGSREFLKTMMRRHGGWECPIRMYTLDTSNRIRKYLGIFDMGFSLLDVIFTKKIAGEWPSPLFFVSMPEDFSRAQKAMTRSHKSQMVWFRWGWILCSRYMLINYLRREKIR
jgi:N-acetylglucosaminylphosphatidylinositol deacetylase